MAGRARDEERETWWRRVLAEQGESGTSVQAFCRERQLNPASFYAWRRTIAERDGVVLPRRRRRVSENHAAQPAFVPLVLRESTATTGLAIELRGGRTLRLPPVMPIQEVVALVRALEAEDRA